MDVTNLLDLASVPQDPIHSGRVIDTFSGRLGDGRTVVIKTARYSWCREKMKKLLDIWAECKHPNILQLIGKATLRGELAAVHEWHEYVGVRPYMQDHPTADPYQLSSQICEGVAYLHSNDIIHGDLHGNKILVSKDGIPRIPLSRLTSTSTVDAVGSPWKPRWDAPEIIEGSEGTFARDVYSLGMTILEAITRRKPYSDTSAEWFVEEKVKKGELPQRPTETIPVNSAGNVVWKLLCDCWSYNPQDRPSAKYVGAAIVILTQTPDVIVLREQRLVVRSNTTVDDLVPYFEQRGLINYTNFLHPSVINPTSLVSDTALANVYRIESLYHHPVVVKCVKHNTPYKRLKRAARELDCWLSHKHENILPLFGFSVVEGNLAMISPWMKNGCVTEYVGVNPDCDRLGLSTQLARAVAYLHKNNLVSNDLSINPVKTRSLVQVHGDVKGPNVLVSDAGTVQVTDFGVSIADHREIEFSGTSTCRGTQRWEAPEILLGPSSGSEGGDSSKEGDVYALSMTMIEIYTGDRPYGSVDWSGRMSQGIISGQLRPSRPMKLLLDALGDEVWQLMICCWAGSPGDRPTSEQVYAELMRLSSVLGLE